MNTIFTNNLKRIQEGCTELLVPKASLEEKVPPHYPAFFNPLAKLNRDISMYLYKAFLTHKESSEEITFADALGGIGSRGLRVAVEIPRVSQIFINDINESAISISRESATLNSITEKCIFSTKDVCEFLISHNSIPTNKRFSIIDLDPFGSPAPFVDCILRSIQNEGLISITATDTAVLSGKYQKTCLRKYFGVSLNNVYSNETAIRLLLSSIALTAARLGISIIPIFVHSNRHYLRVYIKVFFSNTLANEIFSNIGLIEHCFKCQNRHSIKTLADSNLCKICDSKTSVAGQLWIGNFYDKQLISVITRYLVQDGPEKGQLRQIQKIFTTCLDELDGIPYYFSIDEISSILKTAPMKLSVIIEKISSSGFRASKTILNPAGFKTNASIVDILSILKN
ncbi:MAG: tRNA (guanine(10)-N(2))-dimethyltransferase [Nitrososphaeraceae archaeon]|nr:tRNA (guanine(10)-N(2))-dimethyltransferase [Nitrososphaeraceae archaeon]